MSGSTGKRPTEDGSGTGEKKQKLSFGISKQTGTIKPAGLQIKLNTSKSKPAPPLKNTSVFNDDSDDEPEEMPREARMRMRNIGRETPTSAGPNSFGKTKQGFTNSKKLFEKSLLEETLSASEETKSSKSKTEQKT